MSVHIRWLNTRYRDQLVRELQALQVRKGLQYCEEVKFLMAAVEKDRARHQADLHRWLRRWTPAYRVRRTDESLFASDLYLLEATLIEHLDEADLAFRVLGYRDMLSNLLTHESYSALAPHFMPLDTPSPDGHSRSHLLSEARSLISRLYRRYAGVPAVEDIRMETASAMLVFTALGLGLAFISVYFGWSSPNLMLVGACGAVGAAISTIERLYRIDPKHEPFKTWLAIKSGAFTLYLSPFIGFVFALVLYALMRADLLGGVLVPKFACLDIDPLRKCPPATPTTELAKLLCWGFLAGWAERMVPDVLNKLVPHAVSSVRTK
jgi:hypothetical protein